MDNQNLLKYKGWKCNIMTIKTIEYDFHPYKIMICNIEQFNNEINLYNTIRCLIENGYIINLRLN